MKSLPIRQHALSTVHFSLKVRYCSLANVDLFVNPNETKKPHILRNAGKRTGSQLFFADTAEPSAETPRLYA